MHSSKTLSLTPEERIDREAAEWVALFSEPSTSHRVLIRGPDRMELDRRIQLTLDEYRAAMAARQRTWSFGIKTGFLVGVSAMPAFVLMEIEVGTATLFSISIAAFATVLADVWRSLRLASKQRDLQQRILELHTLGYVAMEFSQTSRPQEAPKRSFDRDNVINLSDYRSRLLHRPIING